MHAEAAAFPCLGLHRNMGQMPLALAGSVPLAVATNHSGRLKMRHQGGPGEGLNHWPCSARVSELLYPYPAWGDP